MCIKNLYSTIDGNEVPNYLKEKINNSIELTGDAFFLKVFGNNLEASRVYYQEFYEKIFYGGVSDIRLKELIRLRLAGISGCKYCISVDENSAIKNGISELDIQNVKNNNLENFINIEKNLLQLTNHISLKEANERAEKSLIQGILEEISMEEYIELLFVIAILTGMGNMLGSVDLVETD